MVKLVFDRLCTEYFAVAFFFRRRAERRLRIAVVEWLGNCQLVLVLERC